MNGEPNSSEDTPNKVHMNTSFPSDYSDVQPSSYDPDFISDISNKMQVPHNLGPTNEARDPFGNNYSKGNDVRAHNMMVPERILVAGEGQHIAAKETPRLFDLSDFPHPDHVPYVGLMTPPRTLTLEEHGFPSISKEEEPRQHSPEKDVNQSRSFNGATRFQFPEINKQTPASSGHGETIPDLERSGVLQGIVEHIKASRIARPIADWVRSAVQLEPYTPGASLNDSLLLNEEDEPTLLRTQVAKLARKVTLLEEDNIRRSNYEKFVYPIVFGWSIWKVVQIFWSLFRPRHY